jgi:hypothetical protein
MTKFETMEAVREAVEQNQNVLTVEMYDLREAYGAGRLGVHVRANISAELEGLGLGHLPPTLPDAHYEHVRIYRKGSPAARLIAAVLEPGTENDEAIRQAVAKELATIIKQIQELVCDIT